MLNYEKTADQFDVPNGIGLIDLLPNGKLVLVGVSQLFEETAPGSRKFTEVDSPEFGAPAFFRLSPSGKRAAVGIFTQSSQFVQVFPYPFHQGAPTTDFQVSPFDAEWAGEEVLLVNGMAQSFVSSQVTAIDVDKGKSAVVIANIPGASGGVTIDLEGNLYTGIGAAGSNDPSGTGLVKGFKSDLWRAALTSNPLDFAASGREVANLLTAASLGIDHEGNLLVGGGAGGIDNAGTQDQGYAAVVAAGALRAALFDQPPVEPTTAVEPHQLQRLDPTPATSADEHWAIFSNPVRRELYLQNFGSDMVEVYRQRITETVVTVNVHLGDNPSAFPGPPFVGMHYVTPLQLPDTSSFVGGACLRLRTQFVETLGFKHSVKLNDIEIGTMTDGSFLGQETFEFWIPRDLFEQIAKKGNPAELSVDVAFPGSGLADDFLITQIGLVVVPS